MQQHGAGVKGHPWLYRGFGGWPGMQENLSNKRKACSCYFWPLKIPSENLAAAYFCVECVQEIYKDFLGHMYMSIYIYI